MEVPQVIIKQKLTPHRIQIVETTLLPHVVQQPQETSSSPPAQHPRPDTDEPEFTLFPQQSRSKSKSFYCPNCGNCYGAAGSLKLHIRACIKQKETEARHMEARKCNICGKIYNSISYLKEHILRHSGKAPRKCPQCYRKFLDDTKLQQHIKTHENEASEPFTEEKKIIKEYNCSFCQKTFRVVFDSRYTKRRYACDECRDKFTNEENLRHHKESLEEKKDFHCERCGRRFVFEGFLQRHATTCDGTIKRKRDRVFSN